MNKLFNEDTISQITGIFTEIKSGTKYENITKVISAIGANMLTQNNAMYFYEKSTDATIRIAQCKFLFTDEEIIAKIKDIAKTLIDKMDYENENMFYNVFSLIFAYNAIFIKNHNKVKFSDN